MGSSHYTMPCSMWRPSAACFHCPWARSLFSTVSSSDLPLWPGLSRCLLLFMVWLFSPAPDVLLIAAWIHLHCLREIGNLSLLQALVVCLCRFYLFLSVISVFGAPPPAHPPPGPLAGAESSSTFLTALPARSRRFSRRGPHSPPLSSGHRQFHG